MIIMFIIELKTNCGVRTLDYTPIKHLNHSFASENSVRVGVCLCVCSASATLCGVWCWTLLMFIYDGDVVVSCIYIYIFDWFGVCSIWKIVLYFISHGHRWTLNEAHLLQWVMYVCVCVACTGHIMCTIAIVEFTVRQPEPIYLHLHR